MVTTIRYFLGIEVARGVGRVVLTLRKYILDPPTETGMLGCSPLASRIYPKIKLIEVVGRES